MLEHTMLKNIFNVKKSPFWITTIGIVLIVLISIGIHNNSTNETSNASTDDSSLNYDSRLLDFHIMTVDNAPIGCEYGTCKDEKPDYEEIQSVLDDLQGFTFKKDYVPEHIEFQFSEETPSKISLQYSTEGNELEEYFIDDSYQIEVPDEIGVHDFIAHMESDSNKEWIFFRITVTE